MADPEAVVSRNRIDTGDTGDASSGTGDPAAQDALDPGAQQFVEGMGLYFERLGIPRIGGRILGLLMLAERPLTLDEMAHALKVSRASVSTNARMSVAVGMVEHVSLPGDRRDYYSFSPNAWTRRIEAALPLFDLLGRLAEQGLATLDPENTTGRMRLETAIDFCDFYRRETEMSAARWKGHLAQHDDAIGRAGNAT